MSGISPFKSASAALFALTMMFCATALAAGQTGITSKTKTVGAYTITLKVLPAEPFVSPSKAQKKANTGEMVNAGGAKPVQPESSKKPNHHLVVFLKKHGKPVESAHVRMRYTKAKSQHSKIVQVPVNRMWVAGKGRKTMHFGNNVNMPPGKYVVYVVVNNHVMADFHIDI